MTTVISRRRFTKLTLVSVTALAAGCSVVLIPSEQDSYTHLELAHIAH